LKPPPFDYAAPRSLEEALELLARHGGEGKVLAGGQSLLPVLNFRLAQPSVLIDINRVPGLDRLDVAADGALVAGALVRHRGLERDPTVARAAPLLAEAIGHVAHPQIRARGTLGGSLAHADPAAELPVVAVALDARLRLLSRTGERWMGAADFFTGLFATALAPEELVVEVRFPPAPARTGYAFLEAARRHGDYAQAGVAASVALGADGRCAAARLVFLSVGEGPRDARRAAGALAGEELTAARIAEVARAAADAEIEPLGDIHASAGFKRHLARVLAGRALETARRRAAEAAA
jgi:carbon-monoxide dehydrogenase medium subunit